MIPRKASWYGIHEYYTPPRIHAGLRAWLLARREKITANRKILLSAVKLLGNSLSPQNISRWSFRVRKYQDGGSGHDWHSLCFYPLYMQNAAKKILIVDENDTCRQSLGALIKGLGYEVFEAITAFEAIDRASSLRPDLIMMDLRLPGMSGDEATKRLKANMSTRNIPVIINTAWTTALNVGERVDRALEAGAEEVLYKPFHLSMLRDVLRTYLMA